MSFSFFKSISAFNHLLLPCYSKCGPWTSSVYITGNLELQTLLQTYWINLHLTRFSRWFFHILQFEKNGSRRQEKTLSRRKEWWTVSSVLICMSKKMRTKKQVLALAFWRSVTLAREVLLELWAQQHDWIDLRGTEKRRIENSQNRKIF